MADRRKSISKKLRFEVFKRDKFTCQYCGRSVPDVVLHVDHIKPVAKGGKNEIMNLITSCQDCNLGKGARELSDDSVVKKQQRQIQELADRNEQLGMMLKWREGLAEIKDKEIETVNTYLDDVFGVTLTDEGRRNVKKLIREFGLTVVLDATDIAYSTYFDGSKESSHIAFKKIGGICYNKTRKDQANCYYFNYLKKTSSKLLYYSNIDKLREIAYSWIEDDDDFETTKKILFSSRNWTEFINAMYDEFDK